MHRRTLLRRGGALGAFALAGCVANGDDGTGNGNNSSGGGSTPTKEPVAVETSSVETTKTGCASGDTGTASVSFDPDATAVGIEGVLQAATPCHVASLAEVTYDSDTTVLSVTVVPENDGSDMCEQCIGAIEYAATVETSGGLPGTVAVTHGTGEDATEVVRVAREDSA